MNELSTNLLDHTEQLFRSARLSLIEAAAALYEVRKTEAWKERHETWQDFLFTISVSQPQASKMLAVFEHYAINGGVSHAKVAEVDLEKLYLSTGLEGSPEEQVTKASLLSRSEIRAQRVYETTGEEHEHRYITFCEVCHQKPE